MPKKCELPFERAKRKLRNRGRDAVNVVLTYFTAQGVKREVRLHDTKGYRDVRA